MNYGSCRKSRPTKPRVSTATPGTPTRGRFGLLVNAAYSNIVTRTEAVNMTRITTFCSDYPQVGGAFPDAVVERRRRRPCNTNPYGGTGWRYAPGQVNFSQVDYDRTRYGAALALQYENDAKNLQLTLHGIDSRYENPWLERSANISWPTGAGFGTPVWAPFGAPAWRPIDRQLQLRRRRHAPVGQHRPARGCRGLLRRHERREHQSRLGGSGPAVRQRRGRLRRTPASTGSNVSNEARIFDHDEQTRDFSFNVKWDITENLHTELRRAVHQGARPTTTTSWSRPTASRSVDYTTDSNGTPKVALSAGTERQLRRRASSPIRITTGCSSSRITGKTTTRTK